MFSLMKFLKPYWWQVILLLVATAGQALTTMQLPALMADIINNGIVGHDMGYVWRSGGIMVLVLLVSGGCAVFSHYFSAKIGAAFSRDVRAEIYKKVVNLNLIDVKDFSTASLINRTTNDVNQVQMTIMMMLSMMLFAPMMCIFGLIMAVRTAAEMSWIMGLGVAIIVTSAAVILMITMPKFKVFQKLIDRLTLLTRENLTGLRVIRAFDNEKLEKEKFEKTSGRLAGLSIFLDRVLKLEGPIVNLVFNGATLLCTFVGISLLNQDYAYLGNMSAFAQYVSYVMMSFLMLSILFVMLPRGNVCAGRIKKVLIVHSKIKWQAETDGVPEKMASVEFKNVDFAYPGAEEKVLDKISFVAKAGETTAFIGSTGSGKSTLVNLVPRFYEATSGEILIDGIDIKKYKKEDLIRKIGLVPQKGVLFAGTVKSNIKFGAPEASEKDIHEAAKIAQASSFIEKLPDKYNSHIAQGGTNVSGGQKQRLSIARAICKKPDIFIFDDSFSALDMKTDKKLREALEPVTKQAATIIVAQRVNTIKDAEQIIVLDKGKTVGRGKHLELLKSCEVYRSIVQSQLSEEEFRTEMRLADV